MCGLALCLSKTGKHTGQRMLSLYQKQASRGKLGFGYIAINNGEIVGVHRSTTEAGIKSKLVKDNSEIILFHHRLPTSTKNTLGTTHPIFVSHDELEFDYYFAHNGVITNAAMLKKQHEEIGYEYNTEFTEKTMAIYKQKDSEELTSSTTVFNDSEALAIELARFIEGKKSAVATYGGAAFWGVSMIKGTNKVETIVFGKNKGRDLCMETNKKWFIISSETGENIEDMKLFTLSMKDREITETDLHIDEAKPYITPATRMGFNTHVYELPERTPPVTKLPYADTLFSNLKNALYTYREAMETGEPISLFFTVRFDGATYYVPYEFGGENPADRKLFSEEYEFVDVTEPVPEKTRELVEDLAMKIAEVEARIQKCDDDYQASYLPELSYRNLTDNLTSQLYALEEQIYSHGVDETTVNDTIEIARDIHQYDEDKVKDYSVIS